MLICLVWEELAVWNVDFSPLATVDDLSTLEVKLLELLDYDVFMKASEYLTC